MNPTSIAEGVRRPASRLIPSADHSEAETPRQVHDAATLDAILPFAFAQARRHHETLSILCLSIDRLAAIEQLHGDEFANDAVLEVAGSIARQLRASDVVARLDDNRVIALLPGAAASDAIWIAESIRQLIAVSAAGSRVLPLLTASIGVANYPAHANDVPTLLAVAEDARSRAHRLGRDRVTSANPPASRPALSVMPCAG